MKAQQCFLCPMFVEPVNDEGLAVDEGWMRFARVEYDHDLKRNEVWRGIVRIVLGLPQPDFVLCDGCAATADWRQRIYQTVHKMADDGVIHLCDKCRETGMHKH